MGQALLGQPRFPFGPDSGPACLPLPLSPARGRPPRPSQRRPRDGRTPAMGAPRPATSTPLVGTPTRAPRNPHPFCRPRLPLLPPLASATAAVGALPKRHRRRSSAAHRRPRQCPNLDAKTTSTLAVVAVSSCERSTEVRARRMP